MVRKATGLSYLCHVLQQSHGDGPRVAPRTPRAAAGVQCEEDGGNRVYWMGVLGSGLRVGRGGALWIFFLPFPWRVYFLKESTPKLGTKILEPGRSTGRKRKTSCYFTQKFGAFLYIFTLLSSRL